LGAPEEGATVACPAALSAYLAAALNLAAEVAILVLLRPGLPANGSDLTGRVAYMQLHRTAWWGGWLVWHAAALMPLFVLWSALMGRWLDRRGS